VRGVAAPSPLSSPVRRATRFMGREGELARFAERWERARRGAGQVIVVSGEAGLGKSRLVEEFRRSLAMAPHTWLEARSSPFATSVPLDPIVSLLRRSLSLAEVVTPGEIERAVRTAIGSTPLGGLSADDGVALVCELLAPVVPEHAAVDAEMRRFQLLDLLVDWVAHTATVQPTVFYVEDYHWADPSTQQVIERCCERAATMPLLVVVAARPDGRPRWLGEHVEAIELPPLPADGLAEIARHLAGPDLQERLIQAIVSRAEGVPLFAEEITAAMLNGGSGDITIPDSIENLLMSRLERHPGLRELAQVASVIGTEFRLDELAHLVDLPSTMPTLAAGVRAGVFVHSDDGTVQTYSFRHALSRDAAYGSMVTPTRRGHHLRFARGLEQGHAQVVERRPDLVAEHFALGGQSREASRWWRRAGDRAYQGAAYPEATRFYELALESAPADDESLLIELNLILAGSIAASRGATHPSSSPPWREVLRLAEQLGDRRSIAIGLMGFGGGHLARGAFAEHAALLERAHVIIDELDDPALRRIHVSSLIANLLFSGHPQRAIDTAEHADAAGWRSSPWLDLVFGLPADPWSDALYAYALAAVGRFEDARVAVRRVEAAAAVLGLGPSTVLLPLTRTVDSLAGNMVRYAALSEEYYERAVRFRLGTNIAFSRVFALVTRCTLDPSPALLDEVHEAVAVMARSGQLMSAPFMAWMLAGSELACDRPDLADATLALGQAIAEQTGQHWYDGQILARRLRAQAAIGALPDDWDDQAQAVLRFTIERTLRVGSLHLAMAVLDLRRGTPEEARAAATLRRLLGELPDGSDTPLRRDAIATLSR
jgi:AAA ATPase domain